MSISKVSSVTGVRNVVVEVKTVFSNTPKDKGMIIHYVVEFSDKEYAIIHKVLLNNSIPYAFWRTKRDNIAISKVRKIINLDVGKSFQSRIADIKVL